MKYPIHIALVLSLTVADALAQDPDPFFASQIPMRLDPSRTGFLPGGRVSFIHQDAWLQMPGSFSNGSLQAEWSLRNTRKVTSTWLGVGLAATREQQGPDGGSVSSVGIAPAVHVRTGARSYLSSGSTIRWVNSTLGTSTGKWGSQYDGLGYDASLPSGEAWTAGNSSWIEARAGLSWSMKQAPESQRRRQRDILIVGVSADHLGQLMLRENGPSAPNIPMRFTAYVLAEFPHEIWDNGFFAADLIGHSQGPFNTGRINMYAGKHLYNTTPSEGAPLAIGFKAGLGYRLKDALLVNAALDVGPASIGVAYGWSVFNQNSMVAGRRTFELMLQLRAN